MSKEPAEFSRAIENLIASFRNLPENRSTSTVRKAHAVGEAVEVLMVKYQIGRSSPDQTIRDNWASVVGVANASYSHAVTIDRGRLLILVSHAVVRNEMFLHRAEIVEKIKKLPGCEGVRDINLRSG